MKCIIGKVSGRVMKISRYIKAVLLAVATAGWGSLLAGCTDRAEIPHGTERGEDVPFRVASLTRAGGDGSTDPLDGMTLRLFLASGDPAEIQSGSVSYGGTDAEGQIWQSAISVKLHTDYKIFGFMPAGAVATSSVEGTAGTTPQLTLNGLDAVSDMDVCAITGVKSNNGYTDVVTPGMFDYKAELDGSGNLYGVHLLASHLYAAAELKFKVDAGYSKLRTIKLKKVKLKNTLGKVNGTVRFEVGNSSTPITSVILTPADGAPTVEKTLFDSEEGVTLKTSTTTEATMTGYFAYIPSAVGGLAIESVYDVYDTNGDKIREDCHAENRLSSHLSGLERGKKKSLTITVNPTYLYQLTDHDPDTPMAVIGD